MAIGVGVGLVALLGGLGGFELNWSAGIESDSTVSLIEIDTQTAEGDIVGVFDVGVEWSGNVTEGAGLKISYDLGADRYQTFDTFNTTTHRFSGEIDQRLGEARVGVTGNYVNSQLDGDGFIKLARLSPYVQTYLADRAYLIRGTYIYTDKDFVGRVDRDAEVHAVGADLYRFFNGARQYVTFGVRYTGEDTVADEFDFNAVLIRASAIQRFDVFRRSSRLKVGGRWQARDYVSITPQIGEVRDDDRYRAEGSLEIDVTKRLFIAGQVRYNNNVSNLPAANFDEVVATLSIGGTLF